MVPFLVLVDDLIVLRSSSKFSKVWEESYVKNLSSKAFTVLLSFKGFLNHHFRGFNSAKIRSSEQLLLQLYVAEDNTAIVSSTNN